MKILSFVLLSIVALTVQAAPSVYRQDVQAPMPEVYQQLYQALESKKMWVVFEPDMGSSIAGLSGRLGENYNRNGLQGIRSLVTCNAWYANEVSNLDPAMLALCPLRVTVIHKDGTTSMLFARPSVHAQGSAALPLLQEIEGIVIEAIQSVARP